jgi:hypothetical protein
VRGTECTPEQLAAARHFLSVGDNKIGLANDDDRVALPLKDLVRIVAWYGAIQFEAGQNGRGTLDRPLFVGPAQRLHKQRPTTPRP